MRNQADPETVVLEGLKGEAGIAEICRRECISPNLYYSWRKELLEAASGDSWAAAKGMR